MSKIDDLILDAETTLQQKAEQLDYLREQFALLQREAMFLQTRIETLKEVKQHDKDLFEEDLVKASYDEVPYPAIADGSASDSDN